MARKRRKKQKEYDIEYPYFNLQDDTDFIKFLENDKSPKEPRKKKPRKKAKVKKKRKPVGHMRLGDATTYYHTKRENKLMENGKTIYDFKPTNFNKNDQKGMKLTPGAKNKKDDDVKTPPAPKGYHWKVTHNAEHDTTVPDYGESDVFSDFHGNFFLKKVGNEYTCWIEPIKYEAYDKNGSPAKTIENPSPICKNTWTDPDGSHSFALARVAAYFCKHNIYEDTTYHPHVYNDVNMGCGELKVWNILGEGNDDGKPHIIAHAGETIIIDTGRMKVSKSDGYDLTKYTSFGSTFPPLEGSELNQINFYPTQGTNCDVKVDYIPRIR